MDVVILFWYLVCYGNECYHQPYTVTRAAAAIAACESGDSLNYGTYSLRARSHTNDGGIFQFNDETYLLLMQRDHAENDSYANQYRAFRILWDDGRGWKHWKSSKSCWDQWLVVNDDGIAVWK